ncbi:MAG: class I SAM-dependent methyltransferase [Candidatus Andersenbacteria bacterium]
MVSIFTPGFLSGRHIDKAMEQFAKNFQSGQKVLDIGCGRMPYKHFFNCSYVGVDPVASVNPDVVAPAWDIPLPNASVDGIILNQSLEHIAETENTVQEIKRILKPGGLLILTVPHTVRDHSDVIPAAKAPVHTFNVNDHPYWRVDYYRFTKFGLIYLFRGFETVSITPTTGYIGSLFQLSSLFFASLGLKWVFSPIYVINNILALGFDSFFASLQRLPIPSLKKFYHYTYLSLPMNHIAIFRSRETLL